ncbi:MAG: apolipoprotein N-acyltransferase [Alphaproteobacteria bacterium]|nr:apolipoprotein N-acyltransferase [Alphaproteobacteria bacterium]
MSGMIAWAAGLCGWRASLLALSAGAAAAAGFAPLHALPLAPLGLAILLLLLRRATPWRALSLGWCFGFGHFLAGLYWVGLAFLVEADRFAWLIPFAVSGLPALLAVFPALAAGACVLAVPRPGFSRALAFAAGWTALEWLRAHALTGFPWNLLGHVWTPVDTVLQAAAWFGAYGLSFLTAFAGAALAAAAEPGETRGDWQRRLVLGAMLPLGLFALLGIAGGLRLREPPVLDLGRPRLTVVQPNIAQADKWRRDLVEAHFAALLRLSQAPAGAAGAPRLVVWPETATAHYLANDVVRRRLLAGLLGPADLLLAGTVRHGPDAGAATQFWNSLVTIDARGETVALYDKHHLVPFGEYLPFRPWLELLGLNKLAAGRVDFSFGPGPRSLSLPGLPAVQPLICYEVIFPHEVGDGGRPRWLLTVTNDAWFGTSSGPYQHFEMARLRAVEQGLPLVRAANTGVSGVIGPHGEVIARLPLNTAGRLDAALPPPLVEATLYARLGDWILLGLLPLWSLATWCGRRRTRHGWTAD